MTAPRAPDPASPPGSASTPPVHRGRLALTLAVISMLGPFAIDTYMPSFPAIAQSLEATPLQMQQTLSAYLIAFAFMLLFHGALSDSFGRRPVILMSLIVFTLASVGCVFSYDIRAFLIFRALQGMSGGAGMVVGRAIIRDLYQGADAQRLMARVTMIFGLAPAVAPVLGGWLQVAFGWHSIFVFLCFVGIVLYVLAWYTLPESHPPSLRTPFHPTPLLRGYVEIATHPGFLLLCGVVAFNFTAFFLYIAAAPRFVMGLLHLSESQFAWLFLPGILGIMGGAFLSGRLAGRIKPRECVRLGYLVMGSAAALNLAGNALFPPAVPWAVLPVMMYTLGMQLVMPSVTLMVLDKFPLRRGLAASLQGFMSSSVNALTAGLLAAMFARTGLLLAMGMALLLGLGYLCWTVYRSFPRWRG